MKTRSNLIIGSNSFLGTILCQKLYEANENVLGVYHKNMQHLFKSISHIPVAEMEQLNDDFDVVYIVSAYIPSKDDAEVERKLYEANVLLVKKVCDMFSNAKIVYCSTVSVYKETENVLNESSETNPSSPYGCSKLQGEQIVKQHNSYAIVRISSMYGEYMKTNTFLPNVIKQALKNGVIVLYGTGGRLQNYIHVADAAVVLIAAAECMLNTIFLATSEKSISNKEIGQKVKKFIPVTNIIFIGEDNSNSYFYDNSYTNKTLQLPLFISLEEGLNKLISWMKK
jgi:UDP-glucose 4-epimerase